jgi:hypothetical protein
MGEHFTAWHLVVLDELVKPNIVPIGINKQEARHTKEKT